VVCADGPLRGSPDRLGRRGTSRSMHGTVDSSPDAGRKTHRSGCRASSRPPSAARRRRAHLDTGPSRTWQLVPARDGQVMRRDRGSLFGPCQASGGAGYPPSSRRHEPPTGLVPTRCLAQTSPEMRVSGSGASRPRRARVTHRRRGAPRTTQHIASNRASRPRRPGQTGAQTQAVDVLGQRSPPRCPHRGTKGAARSRWRVPCAGSSALHYVESKAYLTRGGSGLDRCSALCGSRRPPGPHGPTLVLTRSRPGPAAVSWTCGDAPSPVETDPEPGQLVDPMQVPLSATGQCGRSPCSTRVS
jgi:hypothetical protein